MAVENELDLQKEKEINKTVSHLEGVRAAVLDKAKDIASVARSRLSQNRAPESPGKATIEVSQHDVDSYVSLVDPAALSIEFGHYAGPATKSDRTWVEGAHVFDGWYFSDLG